MRTPDDMGSGVTTCMGDDLTLGQERSWLGCMPGYVTVEASLRSQLLVQ